MDPITISTGIGIGKNVLQFAEWLRGMSDTSVISAFFDNRGNRKEGSNKIEVEKNSQESSGDVWWYSVRPVDDYVFIRFPIIESGVYEIIGTIVGEKNADAKYWRYVAEPLRGRIYGGGEESNAKVDFIVIGYKPKAVIKHFSK
jgi:hypothetical protein